MLNFFILSIFLVRIYLVYNDYNHQLRLCSLVAFALNIRSIQFCCFTYFCLIMPVLCLISHIALQCEARHLIYLRRFILLPCFPFCSSTYNSYLFFSLYRDVDFIAYGLSLYFLLFLLISIALGHFTALFFFIIFLSLQFFFNQTPSSFQSNFISLSLPPSLLSALWRL